MRHIRNQNGWIKPVFIIGILALAVYSGIQFGVPYYRYSAFKNEVTDIARISQGDLKKVREDVYTSAVQYKVPVGEDDILIEKKDNKIHIRTSWSHTVDILGFYQKRVDFNVDIEE